MEIGHNCENFRGRERDVNAGGSLVLIENSTSGRWCSSS